VKFLRLFYASNAIIHLRGEIMRLLLVEDEIRLAEALSQILTKNKYTVDTSNDGISGLDNALTGIYDVIILDIMLPKLDGFAILRQIRESKITTPVLFLTAKDDVSNKVKGLDLGADDYLTKPFNTEELLARLRAINRRGIDTFCDDTLSFSDIELNLSTYELSCKNKSVQLGLKEFNIMKMLLSYGSRILCKEELLEKVWGYESAAEYNNVEVYISFLRKKLNHLGTKVNIKTLRGVGYSLGETEDK